MWLQRPGTSRIQANLESSSQWSGWQMSLNSFQCRQYPGKEGAGRKGWKGTLNWCKSLVTCKIDWQNLSYLELENLNFSTAGRSKDSWAKLRSVIEKSSSILVTPCHTAVPELSPISGDLFAWYSLFWYWKSYSLRNPSVADKLGWLVMLPRTQAASIQNVPVWF